MGWISTVTNKGYALQAKLLSTDKLDITRVVSGSGSCATTQLINQTAVTDSKQELIVDSLSYDNHDNARIKVTLNNTNLSTGYNVSQIGIYATDPDEGEILYAIIQTDKPEPIPSISEQPNGFDCSWDFALTYSNAQNVNVTIDPSNTISRDAADKRYVQLSNIGDNLSLDENGVLSADAQEITVDAELNGESTNPVQNKAVYKAIEDNKYTHPSHTAKSSGLYKVQVDSKGHVISATAVQKSDIVALGIPSSNTDTKYTAGTGSLSQTKLFLVGAQESGKTDGVRTYVNDSVYIGTDNCLYSNNKKVSVEGHSHDLPIASASTLGGVKVGSGLTVDSDGTLKATGTDVTIDSALSSSSTNPVQNKVVNSALSNKVDKESGKGLSSNDYTTTEKNKLAGIAAGANAYTHPSYTAKSSALYKVTVDSSGHVSGTTPVTKSDITDLGIPSKDTTYGEATTSAAGLLSATDKTKINGIEEGANKYTHPTNTAYTSGLYKVTVDNNGHVTGATAVQKSDITALGIPSSDTDTKNTAGASNTSNKIYLIGATSQGTNPQTYSHDTAYVGTDGCLYSDNKKVSVEGHLHTADELGITSANIAKNSSATDGDIISTHLTVGYRSGGYKEGTLSVGANNHFNGLYAMCSGYNLEAGQYQTVCGRYNKSYAYTDLDSTSDSDALFLVGCGAYGVRTSPTVDPNTYANALRVSSNGKVRGSQSFGSSGADYAEYMEWEDGNPNNEDRRGRMVAYALTDVECTVEDVEIFHPDTHEPITVKAVVYEKMPPIRYANSFDECIGIITGSASFIGNTASEDWNSRFLKDIYGERIMQSVLIPEETETYKVKEIDEETGEEVMVEKTKVIPEHWAKQFVLNPHYDPEKEYISREQRQEWDPVGMVGMVIVEDDGTCVVGGYCKPSTNGIGTAAETGYRVLQRMDNTHVRVLVR